MGPKDTTDYSVLVIQRTHFRMFFVKKQEKTTNFGGFCYLTIPFAFLFLDDNWFYIVFLHFFRAMLFVTRIQFPLYF